MATYAQFKSWGPYFSGGVLCTLKVYHYVSGTTTLQDGWTDRDKSSTVAQPLVSDSEGIASAWWDGLYKFRIDVATDGVNYSTLYTYDKVAVVDQSESLSGEGAAIASASTLTLGTDGNIFHVTGSTGPITAISGNQNTVVLIFDSTPTLTHSGNLILPNAEDVVCSANVSMVFINEGSGVWRSVVSGATATAKGVVEIASNAEVIAGTDTARVISPSSLATLIPPGVIWEYGGAAAPTGWLLMNQNVSRTTYATLFGVVGTTYGAGDGSTTFGLHKEGRTSIGAGTGTVVEVCTASSGNGFTVASNNTKWITGMTVVWSSLSGFTTSGSAGPTYYVTRISSTNVRFATTLALAQAGTPDITISGTGSCTVTHTYTARTLGEYGGEESHAMSSTELYSHTHVFSGGSVSSVDNGDQGSGGSTVRTPAAGSNANTGGNAAMNIMPPFVVSNFIIKT